jgi:hypothetical protein
VPPLPAIEGVIKLEIAGNLSGITDFANIFHLGVGDGPYTGADLVATWGGIDSALEELYTGNGGTAMTVTSALMTDLSSDTGSSYAVALDWVGGREGISPPASACVMGKYQITRRYRGGHPRTYFPFGSVDLFQNPQSWDTAFVANVAANLQSFLEACLAFSTSAQLGCVSYYSGGVLRETPIFETFTASEVVTGIKSQRRRLLSTTA